MSALREIIAKFGIEFDDHELKHGHETITEGIEKLGKYGKALGEAFALYEAKEFIEGIVDEARALEVQAQSLGVSTDALQEWQAAAKLSGASSEAFSGALLKLQRGAGDKGLAALGIATKDAGGQARAATDIFEDVAEKISGIQNPTERNAAAAKVFGRSFGSILPMLTQGKEGLAGLREEFKELGGGFDEDFIKESHEAKENFERLEIIWKRVKIALAKYLLPAVIAVTGGLAKLVKPVGEVLKHTKLLQTAAAAAAIKGLFLLSSKIGPLGNAFKLLSANVFKTIVPLLLLEDLFVFLSGGDSLIGRGIDKAFGPGAQKKVRDWIGGVKKEFLDFIEDIKKRPGKLLDDWDVFTSQLKKDILDTFGNFFGGQLIIQGKAFLFFLDLLTGGWQNFKNKTAALWDVIKVALAAVWLEIKTGFLLVVAGITDAFTQMWNGILTGAENLLGLLGKIAQKLPGASGIVNDIRDAMVAIEGSKGALDAVQHVKMVHDAERSGLASEARADINALNGPRPPDITNHTEVNVTVPTGTPAEVANHVGAAAAKGAQINLRATKVALVHGE